MTGVEAKTDAGTASLRQCCQLSLRQFMVEGWHAAEGGRYAHNWHIDAMAEHLEAVSFGQIKRLLIIVPPQTTKSILAGTFWPAWEWTWQPWSRWMFSSNNADLAEEESMRCRRLIESEWYRLGFGIPWDLQDDQNTRDYYQNTAGGSRRALGFNASFTGKKAHRIVVDDANDAEKVHSEAERRRTNRKFDNAISDRLINLNDDPIVIIGQRVHINDLIGHVDAQGGWHKLHIREEFIPDRPTNTFPVPFHYNGRRYAGDPRKRRGELLRPNGFNRAAVRARRRANPTGYLVKHQGDPKSEEGKRFKWTWFPEWRFAADMQHIELEDSRGVYTVLPMGALNVAERFGIVDPATSEEMDADYTCVTTWLITKRQDLVFLGCRLERKELPDQPKLLEEEYTRWRMQWAGVEAVYSNRFLSQAGRRTRMAIRTLDPGGRGKLAHAITAIVLAETGRIWVPNPTAAKLTRFPLLDVMDQITSFTGDEQQDEHDDVVDCMSYAVDHFSGVDLQGQTAPMPGFIDAPPSGAWMAPPDPKNPFGWKRN